MVIAFGPFAFDDGRRQLLKAGAEVHLSIKGYEFLKCLLEMRPRVVKKTELHDRLWPDTFVSDATLNSVVSEVRAALGEPARGARFIRTVHGIGYAFSGAAAERTVHGQTPPEPVLYWLTLGTREFVLQEGANLIGRNVAAAVQLDDVSVSRHHARVMIGADGATFEDLGSKNGSFIGAERITGRVPIHDGDQLKVGSVVLTFRSLATPASTETVDE